MAWDFELSIIHGPDLKLSRHGYNFITTGGKILVIDYSYAGVARVVSWRMQSTIHSHTLLQAIAFYPFIEQDGWETGVLCFLGNNEEVSQCIQTTSASAL